MNISDTLKYIVYCLDIRTQNLEIISIEDEDKESKTIQNSHSFNLLCDLNKKKSLYRLEVKNNIIQIIEININIYNGWLSDKISEIKKPIYEIGIINYCNKKYSRDAIFSFRPEKLPEVDPQVKDSKIDIPRQDLPLGVINDSCFASFSPGKDSPIIIKECYMSIPGPIVQKDIPPMVYPSGVIDDIPIVYPSGVIDDIPKLPRNIISKSINKNKDNKKTISWTDVLDELKKKKKVA